MRISIATLDYQKVLKGINTNHHPSDRRNLSPAKPSAAMAYGLTIDNPPLISMEHSSIQKLAGWWYTYPSEKYEFVSWDADIPNICLHYTYIYICISYYRIIINKIYISLFFPIIHGWLVVLTILKNISQWEGLSHIL